MRLILNQNVDSLGNIGDIVKVKAGYARNYLIPRGIASVANEGNEKALNQQLKVLEKKKAELLAEAKKAAAAIEKTSVTVTKQVGEDERIFGSVTTAELEELLIAEGITVNRKDIKLDEEVRKVGVYAASVKVHPEVVAKFKVWVVAQ
ncbi:50S ribosomal protein L9 [Pseudobacteriovorax antillogorgiicola]|uniref:Large ribosomal subunit protein bL9 n=1 Tax=Pseudobacteriovorax antillogorgiicola TaxID=1513793 RepID=A0A1Y6B3L2_9BACT|nr:50S ribosomal protein L9 [Pseudobacteriovorax antillogorgiicola]TCS59284.1 LSU ribosomal protein L9P [Pseudobacteriovorax antillogorgiicola]SME89744.1 LSU ribosomal protein L9P [Pseudobacteriovorax antillogorgiicola]